MSSKSLEDIIREALMSALKLVPVHGVDAEMLYIISDQVFLSTAARLLSPPSLDSLTLLHFYLQSFPEFTPRPKTLM